MSKPQSLWSFLRTVLEQGSAIEQDREEQFLREQSK